MQRPQQSQPPAGDQVGACAEENDQNNQVIHKFFPKGVDPREAGKSHCQPKTCPSQRAAESGPQGNRRIIWRKAV